MLQSAYLVGRIFVHQFCGPFIIGHDFCLVLDGGEMYVKLGESGGVQIWTVFWADSFLTSRTALLDNSRENEAMYAGRSQLIGVFDSGTCRFFRCFGFCALYCFQQVLETSSFLGDAEIQSSQKVGLHGRGVKLALGLLFKSATTRNNCVRKCAKESVRTRWRLIWPHTLQSRTLRSGLAAGQDICSTLHQSGPLR